MKYVVPILLFFVCGQLVAQEKKQIDLDLAGKPFLRLVEEVEKTTGYHFYFDPRRIDSLRVRHAYKQASLPSILENELAGTGLQFAIGPDNSVYITWQFQVVIAGMADSGRQAILFPAEEDTTAQLLVDEERKLFEVGKRDARSNTGRASVVGYVRDIRSGDPIVGAMVYIDSPYAAVNTDRYGYYQITMPRGKHQLFYSSPGMTTTFRQLNLNNDGKLDVELREYVASLKSVTVTAQKNSNTRNLQMGTSRLSMKVIRQVPVVFGEADIMKVVLSLPGVTSAGEAANGFNVRGGASDQNLILMSDATIYNPSHLFGFFSAFNPDVVKGVELYKAAIPEKYGGRLSSVLDIALQDGNVKNWSGQAGIGPLTSKISIGGPVRKDKSSLMMGARTTYSNWLMGVIPNKEYKNSRAGFYDVNIRYSTNINAKNAVYITAYKSNDRFKFNGDTTYRYGNTNANIKWKHLFNNAFSHVLTIGGDDYQYAVNSNENPVNAYRLSFNIRQYSLRSESSYTINNDHQLSFGLNAIWYQLSPGTFEPVGDSSIVAKKQVQTERALETAVYLGDNWTINNKLSVSAGIRYSIFNAFGPASVNEYTPGLPRDTSSVSGISTYASGKIIKTWQAPEIRIGLRYSLGNNNSVKLSYNSMQQYIHMLSNTVTISPTDIWKLSDRFVQPQQGQQVSIGYYHDFKNNTIEASVEGYYKRIKHFLDYKSGASLLMNEHIETDLINTRGKAWGVEFLLKKTAGRLNGWFSYTYSRTFLQQDDPIAGEKINRGEWYPASFDKPHNVNAIVNYRFSHRLSMSTNMVYTTGRPITLPIGVFNMGGTTALLYSDRNQYRIPDYFRADFSITLDGNHKVKQKFHNSWSAGVYNLTSRENPYSVYFVSESGQVKGYQLSIFGAAIPFVTYNIKF